ncbi:hypothetical protein DUNSADRAFT_15392 [Dunaliella salina]|uniref:S1 motif domain-containing protein n=1 Tax=Dunaliella salina TaxID=3046 RepID=A0ABQ7G5I6_DUNSA|nr:hypothetical protein DUNSADRAFT_15392 [Dunaliella salina]|eukprot:KAF5829876.1 hypothetical protein DUNSADRAFT_15392 [Dunaliella salina]
MPPKGKQAGTTPRKRAHGGEPTPKRKPIEQEKKPDVADEDAAFPRGGADTLTKQERQEIEAQARAELDREELETGGSAAGPKRKKQKKGQEEDGADLEGSFLKSSAVAGKVPQYVELLKFKKLVVGMRMWGMVLEVTSKGLQISLPDGLRGTVAPEEACDLLHKKAKDGTGAQHAPLTALFNVGQFVRCAVVGLQHGKGQGGRGGKMVELSCRLRRVIAPGTLDRSTLLPGVALPSEVKAELDHGWTLSFGHKGFEGFLPRAQHLAAFVEGATLAVGQLQEVVVQSAPDARGVVSVSTHPGAVADALTSEGAGLSLEALLPGALVNARVRRVQGDGLLVTFLTFFHGTVDPFHLHLPGRSSTKPGEAGTTKGFTEGMKLKVGDWLHGYCHISNLSDERLPKLDAVYKVGSAVRCRVIGFNLMDGLAHMSARKAVVEQQVLSYNDVVPGMTISGKLYSVDDPLGLWVSVAKNVRALVPALHLPDASSAQKARAKFKVDQTVTGRVLAVDPAAKKMSITLKPGLLTSKLPPIVSPEQAVPGVKTHAVVTGVKDDKGVFLSFYGNVTSLAPTAELGLPAGAVPSAYFHPGQVVRARVTSLDSLGRPRCSLKAGKGAAPGAEAAAAHANGAAGHGRVGDVVDSAVVKAVLEAEPAANAGGPPLRGGALLLDIPSAPGAPARLDLRGHLSDHPAAEAVLRPLLAKQGAQLGSSCVPWQVSKKQADGIVDLSARADLTTPATQQNGPTSTPSKRKKGAKGAAETGVEGASSGGVVGEGQWPCPPGSVQEAVVEVVHGAPAHYAVVSLPQLPGVPLAYVALTDFNTPTLETAHRTAGVEVGEHLRVVVAAAPEPSTGGRLLAVLPSLSGAGKTQASVSGDAIKQSVRPGSVVSVRVAGVGSTQADVVVGKKLAGRVHVSQARDMHLPEGGSAAGAAANHTAGTGSKKRKKSGGAAKMNGGAGSDAAGGGTLHLWHGNPLDGLAVGQQMEAVVLGRGNAGNHGVLELSIKPSVLEAAKKGQQVPPQPSFGSLQPGMRVGCVVSETADDHAWLSLTAGVRGRLHVLDSDAEPQQVALFGQRFKGGLRVQLGGRLHGMVALTDVHEVYVPNALEGLQEGSFVRARVLSCAAENGSSTSGEGSKLPRVTLSLRPSDGGAVPEAAAQAAARAVQEGASAAPPVLPQEQVTGAGAAVTGYVKKVEAKQGMFVTLDRSHDARVKMCNLSDGFIEDPVAAFPEGLLVSGRLVAAAAGDATDGGKAAGQQRLEMTLRSAGSNSRAAAGLRVLSEFKEGEVVAGRVKRVEKFGVFVELEGSNVVGLAHISELLDSGKVKNIHGLYRQNQIVRAKVVSIDLGAARMSLTLKPSEVGGAQAGNEEGPASKRQKREAGLDDEMAEAEDSEDGPQAGLRRNLGAGSSDSGSEQEEGSDDDDDGTDGEEEDKDANKDGHKGAAGDEPGVDDMGDSDSEGGNDDDEEGDQGGPSGDDEEEDGDAGDDGRDDRPGVSQSDSLGLGSSEGVDGDDGQDSGSEEEEEEEEVALGARRKSGALQGDSAPSSPAEFEVLLRSSPNSSYVWIRYMAFLLGLGEADKARAVAQRALQTIYYREEGEKFNVWVALLNLEAAHGLPNPDEALMATFSKAAPYCDQKRLYFALLGSPDLSAAHKLLDRALTSLPKRKHIKVIVQTAMHEFKCPGGSAERGRGVLESVLRNHPKRIDLWSLYIDQEVKAGDEGRTRALFERITSLPLPPRKMKPIFKRWLNWEKSGSDQKRVDYVKQRAMEFVEATTK